MAAVLLLNPLIGETYESGDKLYAYETGTTTAVTLYQDDDLTTAHASPVVADSTGRFAAIYIDATSGDLKIKVTDSDDVERYTVDPFPVNDLASLTADVATLDTTVTAINGRLTTAESEIDTLQTESADYETRISTIEALNIVEDGDFSSSGGTLTLPTGDILKRGTVSITASSASTQTGSVTFASAFPNNCHGVWTQFSGRGVAKGPTALSTSGFSYSLDAYSWSVTAGTLYYLAWGD